MPSNLIPAAGGHLHSGYPSAVLWAGLDAVVRWWDGVELWLTQLGLALQVILLMLVLLPTCWWGARLLDRVVGLIVDWFGHRYFVDSQNGREPQ